MHRDGCPCRDLPRGGGGGLISCTLEVSDADHLETILETIRGLDGIRSVERWFPGGEPGGTDRPAREEER